MCKRWRIRVLALLLALALGCGLWGCATEKPPYVPTGDGLAQDDGTQPTVMPDGETLTLAYYAERTLQPFQCADYTNRLLVNLIYQGLFSVDQDYQPVPILCGGYRVSQDMRTYTLYPAADATFSDGARVTAEDVAASLTAAQASDVYSGRFTHVQSITVDEDGGVTLQLDMPCSNFLLLLDVPIVKASEVEAENPLGTGPYLLEKSVSGLQLRRRTDWWCSAELPVTAGRISLRAAKSALWIRDEFEYHNISLVCADPGSDAYADFHNDYELWNCESGVFLYLACNLNSPVFSDAGVRAALTHAIDREYLVENYYRGFAEVAALPAAPQSPFYDAELAAQYGTVDRKPLTQAVEALLQRMRAEHEEPEDATETTALELPEVKLLVNSDDGMRLRVARILAAWLIDTGLEVTVVALPQQEYTEALRAGEYDLYLGQTKLSANMDLSAFFAPDGALNTGGMTNLPMYTMSQEALANEGNYYTLHKMVMDDGRLCPILFRSYAVYGNRGAASRLTPARDNVFFYTTGVTLEQIRLKSET